MNIANLPAPVFLAATIVFQSAAHILLKFSSHEVDQLAATTKADPTFSAGASSVWLFVLFSLGNLAGLVGVLTYTGVLKKLPLHLAFPLTQGLVALGVLAIGSYGIFHESFTLNQILGCSFVLAGIILLGLRATHLKSSEAELP